MSAEAETPSKFPVRFSWVFTIVFLVLYAPSLLMLPMSGVFFSAENNWHDHLYAAHRGAIRRGDPRLILLAMDDDTGKKYGFPLPRELHARALDELKKLGVKTVIFDVMFMERKPGVDEKLAAATKRFGKTIHLFYFDMKQTSVGDMLSTNMPIKPIADTAYDLGYPNVDTAQDPDGHIRRAQLFNPAVTDPRRGASWPAPSVDAVAYAAFTDTPLEEVRRRWGTPPTRQFGLNFRAPQQWLRHPLAAASKGGKSALNVDAMAQITAAYRQISMLDLLNGTLSAEQKAALKGALAIDGSTSLGYYDHYPTPFLPASPGPEFHLNTIDNMLHRDFVHSLPRYWFLLAVIAMIWLPMLLHDAAPMTGYLVTAGVLGGWWAFGYWGFYHNLYVEFVAPSAALVIAFLAQTVNRVLAEGREKKRIKGLFGQFVAPEVVEDLARNPEKAKLGGEKKEMTMLFLDIAHFTTISEKMPPEALIVFLNRYLSALSQVILDERAVVGNYIGDCIMAFWNAPILSAPDHRARACLAALECQEMMKKLNAANGAASSLPETPAIRIGINSGFVTVGLTGSEKKLQYTVLGDEVNLASRLEGANKFFGSDVMVSEATYEGAKDVVEARELGRVRVVGKETPIRVFELLGRKGALSADWSKALMHYNEGLGHFVKRRYEDAALAFQEVVKIFPKDGPSNLYLGAARDYAAIPPEENWDGVFNLTAK